MTTGCPPRLSLVVSTVGRVGELARLLDSLQAAAASEQVEFILVDQSESQQCARLVQQRVLEGPRRVASSGPGVSVGRNIGLSLATAEIVGIPNDNCWYAVDTLRHVLAHLDDHPEAAGVSGKLVTDLGQPSLLRWTDRPRRVTRRNFWRTTISSTIFLRRSAIDKVGGFDESIGAGAPGSVGSGEESDLVLRVLAAGLQIDYLPHILVHQHDERLAPTPAHVAKMARYGYGQGHLWRVHSLPRGLLLYISLRKIGAALMRGIAGRTVLARADIAFLTGTVAGWRAAPTGRPIPPPRSSSVRPVTSGDVPDDLDTRRP